MEDRQALGKRLKMTAGREERASGLVEFGRKNKRFMANEVIGEIDKVKGQTYMAMSLGLSGMIGNSLGGLMLDTSGGVSFMLTVGLVVSMVGLIMLVFLDSFRTRREALLRTV